jgi:hypothetical protein
VDKLFEDEKYPNQLTRVTPCGHERTPRRTTPLITPLVAPLITPLFTNSPLPRRRLCRRRPDSCLSQSITLSRRIPAPSTHFKDGLERNGGIITHLVGTCNETPESVYHTIRHAAHLVADKTVRRGTAKEKDPVSSVMIWWYSQSYGCAITKALAQQTLNAVSFACSSRGAANHTAKIVNLKKRRASIFHRIDIGHRAPVSHLSE